MLKSSIIIMSILVFALLIMQGVRAQSPSTTNNPTPTRMVPSGAPSTGFGD